MKIGEKFMLERFKRQLRISIHVKYGQKYNTKR